MLAYLQLTMRQARADVLVKSYFLSKSMKILGTI